MKKIQHFFTARFALFGYGMLSFLAFAPYFYLPFLWLALAILAAKNREANHKDSFCNAFCVGAGLGVTGMHWLAHTMLLGDAYYAWVVPFVWIGFGLFFGLYYGLGGFLASFSPSGWRRWLAFAGWFGLLEWVRGIAFSGFPWNVVGNIWNGYLPILQTASVVGVYGLGLLTVLIFTTPFFQHWVKPTLVAVMGLGLLYAFGAWRLYDGQTHSVWGVKLRLVQPDVPCTLKWDPEQARNNTNKLIRLSRENNEQVTHIIWPESAVTFLLNYHHDERLQLMSAMRQGSVLITGAMRSVDEQKRTAANSLFVLDDLTDIHAFYDKSHLVPFGEYTPLRGILPLDKFVPFESDIVAGSGPKTLPILNAPAAAPLVCYEAIFSGEVVDKTKRPAWLINVTNDGWYGFSAGPHHHFAMAQTRAVEEGLPLARAANTGISAVIDPYGRIVKKLDFGEEGVVDADLPQPLAPTPFARYKHWPLWLLSVFFILISFFKQKSA